MPVDKPAVDPIDGAAAYPDPVTAGTAAPTPTPTVVDRLDGAGAGPAEVVLSAERLTASTEWTVTGAVRFRRRITSSTRTVEVTVRREELDIEVRDVTDRAGAWVGTEYRGPAVPPPPVVTGPGVFVLREEIPQVTVHAVPYERVTVNIDRVTEQVLLTDTARREEATVSGDTGTPHPSHRP